MVQVFKAAAELHKIKIRQIITGPWFQVPVLVLLLTCSPFSLFIVVQSTSESSAATQTGVIIDKSYRIENHSPITRIPDMLASYSVDVRSMLECAQRCTRNPYCKAFFLLEITPRTTAAEASTEDADSYYHYNSFPYQCTPLFEWIGQDFFSIENGLSAILQTSSVTAMGFEPLPDTYVYIGELIPVQKTEVGISAVYDLSERNPKMKTIGILFNERIGDWPSLSPACLAQLVFQSGLSGTFLNVTKEENGYQFSAKVVCPYPYYDLHNGDAVCDGLTGIWSLLGSQNVGCVSDYCYRYDGSKMTIYNGIQGVSENGIECQRWDSQTPYTHIMVPGDFPLDGNNMTRAENYCRDPDGEGMPWCYQLTGNRWSSCGIPVCQI